MLTSIVSGGWEDFDGDAAAELFIAIGGGGGLTKVHLHLQSGAQSLKMCASAKSISFFVEEGMEERVEEADEWGRHREHENETAFV